MSARLSACNLALKMIVNMPMKRMGSCFLSIDDLRTHVGIGSCMFAFDFHSHLFITAITWLHCAVVNPHHS